MVGQMTRLTTYHLTDLFYLTVSMPLNCPGMYRGVIREDGVPKTAIFNDEEVSQSYMSRSGK